MYRPMEMWACLHFNFCHAISTYVKLIYFFLIPCWQTQKHCTLVLSEMLIWLSFEQFLLLHQVKQDLLILVYSTT
jgi:hypothetical protein